ncbi:MAG: type II toxin-antitoxin system RelE/ParE family toxin [Clostridia bacterium]|nr:type II toxin-antitoxin system RelE/ParE family toxin [Clostridia bacterium]
MLRESRANGGILVCDNYLIFYRYEDKIVFVSRILSSRRNYTHILFGDLPEDGRDC